MKRNIFEMDMDPNNMIPVDISKLNQSVEKIKKILEGSIIGQEGAIAAVTAALGKLAVPIKEKSEKLPLATIMFTGPTGVGKTEMVCCLAEALTGSREGFTRINCSEFYDRHTISSLIGSPPGYVGYSDEPKLYQKSIDKPYFDFLLNKFRENFNKNHNKELADSELMTDEEKKIMKINLQIKFAKLLDKEKLYSIILFDEVEKAHGAMWNLLLQIVGSAHLAMGSPLLGETNFENSIVILTSNAGAVQQREAIDKKGRMGFRVETPVNTEDVSEIALKAVKNLFPPELFGRIKNYGGIVTFNPLTDTVLKRIIDIRLQRFGDALISDFPLIIPQLYNGALHDFVLKKIDRCYGAREVTGILERYLFGPIRAAIGSGELQKGNFVKLVPGETDIKIFRDSDLPGKNGSKADGVFKWI